MEVILKHVGRKDEEVFFLLFLSVYCKHSKIRIFSDFSDSGSCGI